MLNIGFKNQFIGLCAVATIACGFALPSFAQIDEIIVTAQKRTESLQDVPIAVSAISGDELDNLGVQQASDILTLFPNLNTNAANEVNLGFTIRGVGTNNFHANAVSAVGIYQDEVSRGTPFSSVLGVYDMERVEVLRGPQNTLFGRNTTGGAINYISKKPEIGGDPNGYAKFTYGTHNQIDFELGYGFSLSDRFAIRVSGESRKRDGLFTNQAPGREGEELGIRDRHSFRIQALWEITDRTELLLNYHVGNSDSTNVGNRALGLRDPANPGGMACFPIPRTGGFETVSNCVTPFGFNPSSNDWHTVYNISSAIQKIEIDGFFAKLTHEFNNGIQLTSITAYDDTTALNADENGGGNLLAFIPQQDGEYEQFSQEIRLQGEAEKYRWILGFYHFTEDQRLATMVRRDANLQVTPPPNPGAGQVIAYNFLDQEDEDNSIYAQIEYDVTDATTITGGLRYTDNSKPATSLFGVMQAPTQRLLNGAIVDATWGMNQVIPPNQVLTQAWIENQLALGAGNGGNNAAVPQFNVCRNVANGANFACSGVTNAATGENGVVLLDTEEWGGKFGIDHQLNDNTLVYASYSRGFKAGGHDTRALAATNPLGGGPVGPETLDSYELGVKWENADSTLRINTAVFYSIWGDQQIFAVVDSIPGIYNIEESILQGLDLELLWAPDETWLISAGLGLLDSEIEDNGGLTVAEEGHETRNTPDVSLTGAVSKDVPLNGANLNFFTKARYQDESIDLFESNYDEYFTHDSQFVWDVRITYEFGPDLQYSFSLWGENLTEERFCHDIGTLDDLGGVTSDLSAVSTCSPSDGETLYGMTAKMQF